MAPDDGMAVYQTAQRTILERRQAVSLDRQMTYARNSGFQREISDTYAASTMPYAILGHNTYYSFPVNGVFNNGSTNVGFNYGRGYLMESPRPHLFIDPRPMYRGVFPPIAIPLDIG